MDSRDFECSNELLQTFQEIQNHMSWVVDVQAAATDKDVGREC